MLSKYKTKLIALRATAPPTVNKNVSSERFKTQRYSNLKLRDKPTVVGTHE